MTKKVVSWVKDNSLLIGTMVGVAVGALLGFTLRTTNLPMEVEQVIAFPGELFTRALQMMILPLVISSLVVGSASLNAKMNGKIAGRTVAYFLLSSLINAILGVILVVAIHPGNTGIKDKVDQDGDEVEERLNSLLDNFLDLGRNIVPSNIFVALFQQTQTVVKEVVTIKDGDNVTTINREVLTKDGTNTLGVIFFALIFGTVLGTFGERAKGLIESIRLVDDVIMVIVRGVMWVTPLGVCSIIASKIISVEDIVSVTQQLGLFIITVLTGVLICQLGFYQILYFILKRTNPFKFYLGVMQATIIAFSTASAAVALPITFRCLDRLKVDSRISHFVVPIGITVNMDGTALFVSIASIFIAQMNGIGLNVGDYVTIAISATAVSVASASVPSAALALMFIVLNAVNLPTADIGLLFVVDWLTDRMRTTNNLLGDCYGAVVVEHFSQKELKEMDALVKIDPESSTLRDDDEKLQFIPVLDADVDSKTVDREQTSRTDIEMNPV